MIWLLFSQWSLSNRKSALFTGTGCASAKKNSFYFKKEESLCDLSRLGRNKYYYSANYQRKLSHNTKKIAGK
jgi:hypothetical protein